MDANSTALAKPMPRVDPVMSARFPVISKFMIMPLFDF
jgi:hypothetical protein